MTEVPPLEDVPDVLQKLQERAEQMVKENERLIQEEAKKKKDALLQKRSSQQSSSNFGGMKKGFLFGGGGGSSKTTSVKKVNCPKIDKASVNKDGKCSSVDSKVTPDDIPFIKAQPAESKLVLKEVQEAMIDANHAHDFQDQLAKKLEGHTDVMDVISDPAWLPILDEFQRDPEAAMLKYKNNSKVKKTLQELCNVLGDTFLNMDKSKKTEEEILSGKLMEDPLVKEALTDPLVIKITTYMKQGANDKVQRCIQTATPDQRRHIQTLIDFGLFSFAM